MNENNNHQSDPEDPGNLITPQTDESPISGNQASPQTVSIKIPKTKPVVTWVILGITVLIYLAQILTESQLGVDIPLAYGAKYGPWIDQYHQWWRLITPIFLHGSVPHLFFNMYALYAIGPELETFYGHRDFLIFYLITGFAGNVLSYVASPDTISVGASTSLFGMIAAQGFIVYKNKKLIRNYTSAIYNILFVVLINLTLGLRSGIDNWGHLGGLIAGSIIAFLSGPVMEIRVKDNHSGLEFFDSVPKKSRYLSFTVTTIFFIVLAIAL